MSHGQYVSNSPAEHSVKEQTLMWQGVGQPGYMGDSGIHSGATTQVSEGKQMLDKFSIYLNFGAGSLLVRQRRR